MSRTVEVSALPVGWSRVSGSGVHIVLALPCDDPLVEQLRAALPLDRGPRRDQLDDLLDILLRAGVRGLPDFVAVDEIDPVRLIVRGAAVAELTIDGEIRWIAGGGARTWADVEVGGAVGLVRLHHKHPDLPVSPEAQPSYDHLFGSTQGAIAFHGVDEAVTPPQAAAPSPIPSDLTLSAPIEGLEPGEHLVDPVVGFLRLSTGEVVSLERGVLLGRAPKLEGGAVGPGQQQPHLQRLDSPDNDVSRNHAEIILSGSDVMIRDLSSTNGTTVALAGQSPIHLVPQAQHVLEPGTLVSLGGEVSFTYEAKVPLPEPAPLLVPAPVASRERAT
jgi:hypothetical protein